MPIPRLQISDPINGLPQQRVPLRYAVLITGLPIHAFTSMLANVWNTGGGNTYAILNAYEFSQGGSRPCRPAYFNNLLKAMEQKPSSREQMKLLPPSWYVESPDLATAFTAYIDLTIGRESARDADMHLNWNPALSEYESLIKSCPALSSPSELPQREKRREQTIARHQRWFKEYRELKERNPSWRDSRIAIQIAKNDAVATPGTIRRVISDLKKS